MGWADAAPSDDALIAAVGDQSHEALGEIYRRHGGAVWSVAKRVCRSAELAKDVCQTVFTDLWSRPERFDASRGPLRSWLVAQAHYRAVGATRVARSEEADPDGHDRGPHTQADATAQATRATPTGRTPPSAEVEAATHVGGLAKEARRAIDQLAAPERDAILLAYLGGHTYVETARLLGTPEGAVKARIRRGLVNLRRTLEAEEVTR